MMHFPMSFYWLELRKNRHKQNSPLLHPLDMSVIADSDVSEKSRFKLPAELTNQIFEYLNTKDTIAFAHECKSESLLKYGFSKDRVPHVSSLTAMEVEDEKILTWIADDPEMGKCIRNINFDLVSPCLLGTGMDYVNKTLPDRLSRLSRLYPKVETMAFRARNFSAADSLSIFISQLPNFTELRMLNLVDRAPMSEEHWQIFSKYGSHIETLRMRIRTSSTRDFFHGMTTLKNDFMGPRRFVVSLNCKRPMGMVISVRQTFGKMFTMVRERRKRNVGTAVRDEKSDPLVTMEVRDLDEPSFGRCLLYVTRRFSNSSDPLFRERGHSQALESD
jgi:hypothetical protein